MRSKVGISRLEAGKGITQRMYVGGEPCRAADKSMNSDESFSSCVMKHQCRALAREAAGFASRTGG